MTTARSSATDPTRRALVVAAAWSAPVIAVAIAAPGASASTETGTITAAQDAYRGTRNGDRVEFPVVTGVVTVSNGPMPTMVRIELTGANEASDLRRDAGLLIPIDPATGTYAIDGLYNARTGGDNPYGFLVIQVADNLDPNGVAVDFGRVVIQLIG
ncbi:hypothetical protein [Rathayibacter sp. VKM Ac-2927]|uniref:hypothetical protein n=1 Tax=Rathayibacter sp. VKM Ac-2927 TaxID=2929478 RepID=UPI001FB227E2|nr:hypothetical protein [Rathayibacter sp. VKM Ac-2927]MCJ1688585.1 hypothetical protein [Rathayibacter sp. VKM Ac-2927]